MGSRPRGRRREEREVKDRVRIVWVRERVKGRRGWVRIVGKGGEGMSWLGGECWRVFWGKMVDPGLVVDGAMFL